MTHPIPPIQLNSQKELLEELPGSLVDEEFQLVRHGEVVGVHGRCGGSISAFRVSEPYYVLYCPVCGLRVHISSTVRNLRDLREYFQIGVVMGQ